LPILLALAASVTWGVSDFLGGFKTRHLRLGTVLLWSQSAGLVLTTLVVVVRGEAPPAGPFAIYGALAGLSGLIGVAAFFQGMSIGTMSIVAPASAALAPIIPVAFGIFVGEQATPFQIGGALLALVGVALASREDRADPESNNSAAIGWALLAALGFGGFFLGLHAATVAGGSVFWAAFAQRLASTLALLIALAVVRQGSSSVRLSFGIIGVLCLVGALDVVANVMFATASTLGLVSLTSVLVSLYPVTTLVLARLVLRERLSRVQQTGVVGALAGIVLISAG
jgi:drug/metabolite transporter (DMT)-like permease